MMTKWISVEDALPEFDMPVMVYFGNDYDEQACRIITGRRSKTNNLGDWSWYSYWHNWLLCDATHWMPLPEPPEVSWSNSPA